MRDFPYCFGENGVVVADSSSSTMCKSPQNAVTCIYEANSEEQSYLITITWGNNLMGHSLNIEIADSAGQFLCKTNVKPAFFSKRKGSKTIEVNGSNMDFYWDLSSAKFESSPQPVEGFYIAILSKREWVLLIGDIGKEALASTNEIHSLSFAEMACIAKRENVYGERVFRTKAQFGDNGGIHNVTIECETMEASEPWLRIRVDKKTVIKVKRLHWKFRGNQTFWVDGFPVVLFWDVYNWLFGSGSGVFMFKTGYFDLRGSFEECKLLTGSGFSLILYAWRNE